MAAATNACSGAGGSAPAAAAVADLSFLRALVEQYIQRYQYDTACFWADKLVTLSKGAEEDVYRFGNALFLTQQYRRAIGLIKRYALDKDNVPCILLMARCHFECREYNTVFEVLNPLRRKSSVLSSSPALTETKVTTRNMVSSMHLLCGRAYEAMDNQERAAECFRDALRHDALCFEAMDHLISHHMLAADEEDALVSRLPVGEHCPDAGTTTLVTFLYRAQRNKYDTPGTFSVPDGLTCMSENADVLVSLAERHYYNRLYKKAYKITSSVLAKDPFNERCLPLHIALLVDLRKSHELFARAHELVDLYPGKAVSWYAVGCYYYATGKSEPARRYLVKATSIDNYFGAAWVAFGHSFASDSEHDQATAAYSTAAHVMKGCHLPLLYIGLEHGLSNNGKLAEKFFVQALKAAPQDPFALHEVGVIEFLNERYSEAEARMVAALKLVEQLTEDDTEDSVRVSAGSAGTPAFWEPLLNNLGHVCRKLKRYNEAIAYHQRALALSPRNPSTYSALGLCYMLCLQFAPAVENFHKALALRKEDTVSTSLLNYAVDEQMRESGIGNDFADENIVPLFTAQLDASLLSSSALSEAAIAATSLQSGLAGSPISLLGAGRRLEEHYFEAATPSRSTIEDVSMDITPGTS